MHYLDIGYRVICLSPFLSMFFYLCPRFPIGQGSCGYLWLQTLVIFVQVFGAVLYIVGYRATELSSKEAPDLLWAGILLILWGLFITWYAIRVYDWMLRIYPYKMDFTFCGQMVYVTQGLKGLLWVVSGLVFLVTSLFQRRKS